MLTPSQLQGRLSELGIRRGDRALADWRENGLLPPLRRVGRGRGKGAGQFWEDDILDQAIAAHWLLKFYRNTEEALLGLWLSGYAVDADRARSAWVSQLKRLHRVRHANARRYKDRFLGLAKSGLKTTPAPPWLRDFFADTLDWQYDDNSPLEDDGYKSLIAQGLGYVGEDSSKVIAPSENLIAMVDDIWTDIDVPAILRPSQSIEFVQSMSKSELDFARASLARVRRALAHWFEVANSSTDRSMRVLTETRLMHGLLGPFIAKALVALNRVYPELPVEATIAVLHDHFNNVKSTDLLHHEDGTMSLSEQVRDQWQTVKETLSRLWTAAFAT